ncbi:MAG TPA: hypothetical protein VKF14_02125 [Candidatus Dormibacteraeota bacterium]|nr:hypothetical protein [Candidatus Dormibacteraeota bacterium]
MRVGVIGGDVAGGPMPVETIEAAAAAFRKTGFPQREVFARQAVQPPTADGATAVFERRAGR